MARSKGPLRPYLIVSQAFRTFLSLSSLAAAGGLDYVPPMKIGGMQLGRILGIPVRLHVTFPFFLVLIIALEGLSGGWPAGLRIAGVLIFLFLFVLLHELGHSVVARRYGIPILDITLTPIGGIARTLGLPSSPGEEIRIALAGPAVNFALALPLGIAVALWEPGLTRDFLVPLLAANLMLGLFNMIPAFPMDGGRVLRALLAMRSEYLDATRAAVWVGRVVAVIFVAVALYDRSWILLIFIAIFVYGAGAAELRMARRMRGLAEGRVGDLAVPLPPPIPGETGLAMAWNWLETFPYAPFFAVELDATAVGLVAREELSRFCLALPPTHSIEKVTEQVELPLPIDLPLAAARARLLRAPGGVLPVRMKSGEFGLIALEDLERSLGS